MNLVRRIIESPKFWSAALAAYWLTLLVATHVPRDFPAVPSEGVDKVVHVAAFALLAWLFATAWERSAGRLNGGHLRAVWLVIILYAAVDEWTQPWVGRYGSFGDWFADVVGTAVGLVAWAKLR